MAEEVGDADGTLPENGKVPGRRLSCQLRVSSTKNMSNVN